MEQTRSLTDDAEIDTSTEWSDAAPSTDDGDDLTDAEGYDGYRAWHLAVDPDASEDTKGRCALSDGDSGTVDRAALVHAEQRAAQHDHDEVAKAVDALLQHLDKGR